MCVVADESGSDSDGAESTSSSYSSLSDFVTDMVNSEIDGDTPCEWSPAYNNAHWEMLYSDKQSHLHVLQFGFCQYSYFSRACPWNLFVCWLITLLVSLLLSRTNKHWIENVNMKNKPCCSWWRLVTSVQCNTSDLNQEICSLKTDSLLFCLHFVFWNLEYFYIRSRNQNVEPVNISTESHVFSIYSIIIWLQCK